MEDLVATVKLTSNIISCFARALEFSIVIFLTIQYFKRQSNFRSAYFVILNVGYAVDLVSFLNWLAPLDGDTYRYTVILFDWYNTFFITIWNVVLCLNRCTALVLPLKYDKIWTPFVMSLAVPVMVVFPFLVNGYSFFIGTCVFLNYRSCFPLRKDSFFTGTLVNAVCNSVIILLIILSIYLSNKDKYKNHSLLAKTERRLIYQAIFSSIIQIICFALKFASALSTDQQVFLLYLYISNITYHIQHVAVMVLHFVLSPSFKIAYSDFYRISLILCKSEKVSNMPKSTPTTMYSSQHI